MEFKIFFGAFPFFLAGKEEKSPISPKISYLWENEKLDSNPCFGYEKEDLRKSLNAPPWRKTYGN